MMHKTKHVAEAQNGNIAARAESVGSAVSSCISHLPTSTEHCTPVGPQSKKRLARARVEVAEMVDETIEERWEDRSRADHLLYSNRVLAEHLFDVDEKTVRQWRDADKPMPMAALLCMPSDFGEDLVEKILSARRILAGDRRALIALGRAIDRVDAFATHGVLTTSDRADCARSIRRHIESLSLIAEMLEEP